MRRVLLLLLLASCSVPQSPGGVTVPQELYTSYSQLFAYGALSSYEYAVATPFGEALVTTTVAAAGEGYLLNTTATLGTLVSRSAMRIGASGACEELLVEEDGGWVAIECPANGMNSVRSAQEPLLFAGMVTISGRSAEEYVADEVHYFASRGALAPVRIEAEGSVFTLKTTSLKPAG